MTRSRELELVLAAWYDWELASPADKRSKHLALLEISKPYIAQLPDPTLGALMDLLFVHYRDYRTWRSASTWIALPPRA